MDGLIDKCHLIEPGSESQGIASLGLGPSSPERTTILVHITTTRFHCWVLTLCDCNCFFFNSLHCLLAFVLFPIFTIMNIAKL